jgi:hypothetical protein
VGAATESACNAMAEEVPVVGGTCKIPEFAAKSDEPSEFALRFCCTYQHTSPAKPRRDLQKSECYKALHRSAAQQRLASSPPSWVSQNGQWSRINRNPLFLVDVMPAVYAGGQEWTLTDVTPLRRLVGR